MKILLIQSYMGPDADLLIYPLGLAYIADALYKQGHEVKITDLNTLSDPHKELAQVILEYSPDIIGISIRNIDNQSRSRTVYYYQYLKDTLNIIDNTASNIPVVAGGPGFSMFAEKIMNQNPGIAFGVYLEGEESFPELLKSLDHPETVRGVYYRKNKKIFYTGEGPFPNFGNQIFPERDFIDITPYLNNKFSLGIQTKRGCPFRCAYCNYPILNGRNLRIRSPESVCDEIEYLVKKFGVKEIIFADSVLNSPPEHAESIFREIIKRKINIKWIAYMYIRNITEEFINLAIESGCVSMLFSPDGISQAALDGLQKDLTEADIKNLFYMLKDFKQLDVGFCFFINPPGETLTGFFKTVLFYIKAVIFFRKRGKAIPAWIRLEPYTKAYDIAITQGVINKDTSLLPDDETLLKNTFYRHPGLDIFGRIILKVSEIFRRVKKIPKMIR